MSPAALDDNGAELIADFSLSQDAVCVGLNTPAVLPTQAILSGRVSLSSDNGRVEGELTQLRVAVLARGGQLSAVTAWQEYLVPDSRGLSELASDFAIQVPLEWDEGELGGFESLAEARLDAHGGLLRAIGGALGCEGEAPCEEVCPGPGCTMSDAEKWAVRWGTLEVGSVLPVQE